MTGAPLHVQLWRDFLVTVEVRGPIPIAFRLIQSADPSNPLWILQSEMLVPDRDDPGAFEKCKQAVSYRPIIIQNALPSPDDPTPKELVIRQRVLGHYQHEALESVFIGGKRTFDPHESRWYSNLVADWRFTP